MRLYNELPSAFQEAVDKKSFASEVHIRQAVEGKGLTSITLLR
jgi:hypothetical protein